MAKSSKLPVVAIVGRANVGKSSLFNCLIGEQRSIVAREAGTTRDTVYSVLSHSNKHFLLADTAGLKYGPEDEFEATIQEQIIEAAEAADIILVVVESDTVVTDEDLTVARIALKSRKPVLLVANKIDRTKKKSLDHWKRTGITDILPTSTTQSTGLNQLLDEVAQRLPKDTAKPDSTDLTIALIGRPNVGKSSLFNAMGKKQQALVSPIAGTTRDVNRLQVKYHGEVFSILDTAGIRRPGKIGRGIEHFSFLRAVSAIEEADICFLLIDANEPATHLEQKLAGMIKEAGKGIIVVVTKWDSVDKDPYTADKLAKYIGRDFQHIWWAPLIFTSSVSGQNITKLFELIVEIRDRRRQQLKTSELNRLLRQAVVSHSPAGLKNRHPKLRYIVQSDVSPPAFRIYGTQTSYLHWSYKRRLEKLLREKYDFTGTPIKLYFSDREPRK